MKTVRLIELFAGYGSQAMAIKRLGIPYESYRVVEFDKYAINSYNAVHDTKFPTIDIRDFTGEDLGIVDTDKYNYVMTYSFPCTDLSVAGKMQGMSRDSGTRSGLFECYRLMDVSDEDALKMLSVNSETQCYKQAGNSIVVSVLMAIFKNLLLGGSDTTSGQLDIYDLI